ncbi:Hypothetical protein FKW44_014655 [Caligus rogercresseyi]|uniref:Uncharacterized protein n=1 Tax=Caligus rogercresseyi TaxID=217165 RepID=A0A7T8GZW5_CALRO|nr:Hypothetical protein FKW44_014655 [Caligus rogercresseyi]
MPLDSLLIEKLNPREVISIQARQQAQAVGGALQCYGGGGTVGTFIKNRAHVTRWAGPAHPPSRRACIKLERTMESETVGKDSALLLK